MCQEAVLFEILLTNHHAIAPFTEHARRRVDIHFDPLA
jgi:hypothetical protein